MGEILLHISRLFKLRLREWKGIFGISKWIKPRARLTNTELCFHSWATLLSSLPSFMQRLLCRFYSKFHANLQTQCCFSMPWKCHLTIQEHPSTSTARIQLNFGVYALSDPVYGKKLASQRDDDIRSKAETPSGQICVWRKHLSRPIRERLLKPARVKRETWQLEAVEQRGQESLMGQEPRDRNERRS